MKNSCGFIIRSEKKILICHPFGHGWSHGNWSLPKGHPKSGENQLQAAVRETLEETGLNLTKVQGRWKKIGDFLYPNNRKILSVFFFDSNEDLTVFKNKCSSVIDDGPFKGKPEIDFWRWVPREEAENLLHITSSKALKSIII